MARIRDENEELRRDVESQASQNAALMRKLQELQILVGARLARNNITEQYPPLPAFQPSYPSVKIVDGKEGCKSRWDGREGKGRKYRIEG